MAEKRGGLPVGRDLLGDVAGHQLPGHILASQEVKLSTLSILLIACPLQQQCKMVMDWFGQGQVSSLLVWLATW